MPKIEAISNFPSRNLYDRMADVQHLAMKVNGYRSSVAKRLKSLDLKIGPESVVLDAGCGTGAITLGLLDAGYSPRQMIALDLSLNSVKISHQQFNDRKEVGKAPVALQGNILNLPFSDNSFDLIMMCGVLEYLPLDDGLSEAARVLKPGARLVLLPVRKSVVGSVLELIYKFKIHPIEHVREAAAKYFDFVDNHKFPLSEPIGWSKTIVLLEKK